MPTCLFVAHHNDKWPLLKKLFASKMEAMQCTSGAVFCQYCGCLALQNADTEEEDWKDQGMGERSES